MSFAIRAVALLALLVPAAAHAFEVLPTVSVIELPANRSGITLTVHNPRSTDLPVMLEIFERFVAEDGDERHEPADDDFVVFPPQAVVPAGKSQAVRVQWLGAAPPESRSFHLYASEVPVEFISDAPSQLQRVLRIGASIHVAAGGSQARPVLAASAPVGDDVLVTLANEGERFFYIDSIGLDFDGRHVDGAELGNAAGRTLVPPGGRRTFTVEGVTGTPVLARP